MVQRVALLSQLLALVRDDDDRRPLWNAAGVNHESRPPTHEIRRSPDRARPLAYSGAAPAIRAGHGRAPPAAGNYRRFPPPRTDPLPAAFDVRRLCLGLSRVLENAPHAGAGLRLVGWVCAVHGEHSWVIGNFSGSSAARRLGRQSACRRLGELPAERHRRAIAGGLRLNGRWGFASGFDHAQWILLGRSPKDGGEAEARMCLCRSSEVEIIDDWHVMGLSGTGSKSVAVKDVFVPATHSVILHDLKTGTAPGAKVHAGNPMFRMPRNLLACSR